MEITGFPRPRLIVALLALTVLALAVFVYANYRASVTIAKEDALRRELFAMRDAIDRFRADTGKCPESLRALEGTYIRITPTDPFTKSKAWNYVQTPVDGRAYCDVKSTSLASARDGSRYSDW
jgi:general secretion pathway protein G